ncbi:hypothetical protein BD779DRAFT_1653908 [Infundibulicybe gibba]|nr:hypothetical protein BD779DRAFT_1653908 [Infundibulicybe gibba]
MKFIVVATIVALASTFLVQTQAQCVPSSCRCDGRPAGRICGDGSSNCPWGDVFQCNSDGHTCNFGRRQSCVDCGKLSCP